MRTPAPAGDAKEPLGGSAEDVDDCLPENR
jgi:hypothetical protein